MFKEKVSRLEAQPDKTSSVHVEQDSSTIQENPMILIGEPSNIPWRIAAVKTADVSVADLDKDDDAGTEGLKSMPNSRSGQKERSVTV